jgi:serine/threonine protein kinase
VIKCFQSGFIAKITNLGAAVFMNVDAIDIGVIGQIPFTDPLCLDNPRKYKKDLRSDIYSLGVIFWNISSSRTPFENYMPESRGDFRVLWITMEIMINGLRETPAPLTPDNYVKLYQNCWKNNPAERPNIGQIIKTLNNINYILNCSYIINHIIFFYVISIMLGYVKIGISIVEVFESKYVII